MYNKLIKIGISQENLENPTVKINLMTFEKQARGLYHHH